MASILVVCTGNVCRSPIAEGLLRNALERRFGPRAPLVSSAGTQGWEGSPAMPESIEAAREREIDISGHVARRLSVRMVLDADLILAMADEHREVIVGASPRLGPKTFTLKELVRLLGALEGPDPQDDPDGLAGRVAAAETLRRSGFEGNPHDEDVADPLGMPLESFRAIAWELDEWISKLVDGLFGRPVASTDIFGERKAAP
jgi:protein-tyrosine phosphatase